jgi:hypothetical protein
LCHLLNEAQIGQKGVEMKKELSPKQRDELLTALKARFEKNMGRHQGLVWAKVQARLEAKSDKLWSLQEMERTGGEPDVVGHDKKTGEYIFFDCSSKLPKAVSVFATTVKRWIPARNTSPRAASWRRPQPWASRF